MPANQHGAFALERCERTFHRVRYTWAALVEEMILGNPDAQTSEQSIGSRMQELRQRAHMRIDRGEADDEIFDRARKQARRIEGRRQRRHAAERPPTHRGAQADCSGQRCRRSYRAAGIAAERP